MTIQEDLKQWAKKKLTQSTKDALVNIDNARHIVYHEPSLGITYKSTVKKLISETQEYKKNSGFDSLCYVSQLLVWKWKEEEIKTPIHIFNAQWKKNKLGKEILLEKDEDELFLNPFLVKVFHLPNTARLEELEDSLRKEGLNYIIENTHLFTNLHPYRFNILRELEELSKKNFSPSAFTQILGFEKNTQAKISLEEGSLVEYDSDQENVLNAIAEQDITLQGPPGTGKSQTICNLLSKVLYHNKSSLLSSEKSVALEVIYNIFKRNDLHHFLCFYKGKQHKKVFIEQLHASWNYLENFQKNNTNYIEISKLELNALENKLSRIYHPEAIGGMSFSAFKRHTKNLDFSSVEIDNKLPNFTNFLNIKEELNFFLTDDFFGSKKMWAKLPYTTWSSKDSLSLVQKDLESFFFQVLDIYDENISLSELQNQIKTSQFIHLFYYDEMPLNTELLIKDSKTQKTFFKLFNRYISLEEQASLLSNEKKNWKKTLNSTEIEAFLEFLDSEKGLRFSHFRVKNKLKKLSNLHYSAIPNGLQKLMQLESIQLKLVELKSKLRRLNLPDEIHHLRSVKNTIDRSLGADQNSIKQITELTLSERNIIYQNAPAHYKINDFIRRELSSFDGSTSLQTLKSEVMEVLPFCLGVLGKIQHLKKEGLYAYTKGDTIDAISLRVIKTDLTKFQHLNPDLTKFNGEKLSKALNRLTQLQKKEKNHFVEAIKDKQKAQFDKLNKLLLTPAYKLKEEEKNLKKELRIGKKILIKEFSKTRSYKSLLELMNSEASHWIKCIQPIFLLNTFQVADTLPLTQNYLDLCILDEASQIPYTHALGSIFRAKRCLIAGDSQQMSPAHYFVQDIGEGDILHHASFHFKQLHLKHHYRSKHAEIIAFSNRYFYDNSLKVFPSPLESEKNITLHTLSGKFEEKANLDEALALASFLEKIVTEGAKNIGVVCFNEKQCKLLLKNLDQKILGFFELESNTSFIKSLEKVQGDECDHLIISTTYAPNAEGNFAMRFGPINHAGGEKRLNVLMSRAKEKITVFRSFRSKDMKISENNGVEALRKLMLYLEQVYSLNELIFPNYIEVKNNNLLLIDLNKTKQIKVKELLTQHQVLQERNWNLEYIL